MSKIIFLDFDGVICNPSYCIAMGNSGLYEILEPRSVFLLERLCTETGAKIVVSSSWRYQHSFKELCIALNSVKAGFSNHFLGGEHWSTPLYGFADREGEIKEWLEAAAKRGEEIEGYVILDDCSLARYKVDEEIYSHFVKTDKYDGFGFGDYLSAMGILMV